MRKILVIFAHPKYEHSEVNQALIRSVEGLEGVTIRDLYELYPDFNIDVQSEQELLFEHEVILFQHPFYWYSCPPLLKQWMDLVLEFGWAYGPGGIYLKGKYLLSSITSGGSPEAYQPDGKNRFTLEELLRPFEQTAYLCKMEYLPYFHIGGTHRIKDEELTQKSLDFQKLVFHLRDAEKIVSESLPHLEQNLS